ncbi:ABC transporter substrate-binding protein [Tannerella forsythia]|uniref:ABC transporter substrate-binding protein n=1 Tax=Tannerella forsythia TaxID=28112 RepID=UPI0028E64253|nr:ABC transporter substrate-binding protein [Tannerella forsythia]
MKKKWIVCIMLMLWASCQQTGKRQTEKSTGDATDKERTEQMRTRYAQGFRITSSGKIWLVDIQDPQKEEGASYHYALVPKAEKGLLIPDNYEPIPIPISKVVCMTSLQLSNFIKLGRQYLVTGITSTRHLFDSKMNEQLKTGQTRKIGIEGNFDTEIIIGMDPEIILISPFKRGGYEALKETGVPLIPHLGYKELTPLGQAEWIRLIGLLTGCEEEANQCFDEIERKYNELKALTAHVEKRPMVFSGEMRGGNWYAVGGKSFLAQQFRDAGADYFLKDDTHSGGLTLDFEAVYSQAEGAQYWRIVNSFDGAFSYDALRKEDNRYADFNAFRNKGVIYCNLRKQPFYESAPSQPEVILADLIRVFHPDLLPDYEPVYYQLLK